MTNTGIALLKSASCDSNSNNIFVATAARPLLEALPVPGESAATLALFLVGGELIRGFALALIIGVVVGTYSSIYVAGSAALAMGVSKEDLIPPPKEGEDAEDERP